MALCAKRPALSSPGIPVRSQHTHTRGARKVGSIRSLRFLLLERGACTLMVLSVEYAVCWM